jgi:uncharacterized protein (TIGR02996 family)
VGLFDRLSGDLEATLSASIVDRDALGIVRALAALDDPGEPQAVPAKLRDEAVQLLYELIATMPSDQQESIFELLDRARQPRPGATTVPRDEAERTRWWQTLIELLVDRAVLRRHRDAVAHGRQPEALVTTCAALIDLERNPSALAQQVRSQLALARRISLFREASALLSRNAIDLTDDRYVALTGELIRLGVPIHLPLRERSVPDEPRNVDLERAIDDHPDDADPHAVFGDWLGQHGHPRGALIALQLAAEAEPARATDVDAHIAAHAGALLGPLMPHRLTHDPQVAPAFTWRRGFIDHATLSCSRQCFDNNAVTESDILELLVANPSARRLSGLAIVTDEIEVISRAIARLAQSGRPALRALKLRVDRDYRLASSDYFASMAELWRALPELRDLELWGLPLDLAAIDHARLERLVISARHGLSTKSMLAIAAARLPALHELDLEVRVEARHGDGLATVADLQALLVDADLPALSRLGIHTGSGTSDANDLCASLAASPLATQLEELDLSRNLLGPSGARHLLVSRRAFPRLAVLDVSNTRLDSDAIAALRQAFPHVIGEPKPSPESALSRYLMRPR